MATKRLNVSSAKGGTSYQQKKEATINRVLQKSKLKRLSLDTLGADINALMGDVSGYLGSWQNAATTDRRKAQLTAMKKRIADTKSYLDQYREGYDEGELAKFRADLDELEKTLGEAEGYIGDASSIYGGFLSAEDYSSALAKNEAITALGDKYKDIDSKTLRSYADELRRAKGLYDTKSQNKLGLGTVTLPSGQTDTEYVDSVFKKYGIKADEAEKYASMLEGIASEKYLDSFRDKSPEEISAYAAELRGALDQYNVANSPSVQGAMDYIKNKSGLPTGTQENRARIMESYGLTPEELEGAAKKLDEYAVTRRVEDLQKWAAQQGDFAEKSTLTADEKKGLSYLGNLINKTEAARENVAESLSNSAYNSLGTTVDLTGFKSSERFELFEKYATDDHKAVYNYLLKTQGADAADIYARNLSEVLERQRASDIKKNALNYAKDHPWLASGATVLTNALVAPLAGIETIASRIATGKINENSYLNSIQSAASSVRQYVPEAWAKKYGWDDTAKGAVSFFYGTGLSIADTVATTAIYGGYGGGIGAAISLAAMGLRAGNESVLEAKERGATDAQAFALGVVSGAAEAVFEKIGLDELIKIKGKPNMAKAIAEQMGSEALEEMGTEIVNIFADAVIMAQGDLSNYRQKLKEYTSDGMSELEANLKILGDNALSVILAGAGGALSGGVMGSVALSGRAASAVGSAVASKDNQVKLGRELIRLDMAQKTVQAGLSMGEGSEAYQIAQRLSRRSTHRAKNEGSDGAQYLFREVTDSSDLGKLYSLVTTEAREQFIQSTAKAYEQRLEKDGANKKGLKRLSEAVARAIAGEELTEAQKTLLAGSEAAQKLISESGTVLDLDTPFNPLAATTKYNTEDGTVLITRRSDSRYDISLISKKGTTMTNRNLSATVKVVDMLRDGSSFGEVLERYGGNSAGAAQTGQETYEQLKARGVSEYVATFASVMTDALGGDLRIYVGDTKDAEYRGIWRQEHDGSRSIVIGPNGVADADSVLVHEIFHDLEKTKAGRAFIAAAVEHAKETGEYEKWEKKYRAKGVTRDADIEAEVSAKVAGQFLRSEESYNAILDKMLKSEQSAFAKRLEKAARSLVKKLSKGDKSKGSMVVERRAQKFVELYAKAAKQRSVENALDNVSTQSRKEQLTEAVTRTNAEKMQESAEKPQKDAEKSPENKKASREERADIRESNISDADKRTLKNIGAKKHINDFDSNDIKATEKWARMLWEDLKEKSPFFRAWFGEWRAHSTDLVDVVTTKSDTRGLKKNRDTGWEINRSAKVSREMQNSSASKSGYLYMPYIDGIIENAVLLDSAISDKSNDNSLFYHYLYAVVDDGSGNHVIKLTVEELLNPGKETERRAYKLIDIQKYQPSGIGSPKLTSSQTTGTIKSIADLVAFVKSYDKYFSSAPEVSKAVLNPDGTPKVFYHGSDEMFTVFGYDKIGSATGVGILGEGFYFTDQKKLGEKYGKNVYQVYLRMSKPYMASQEDLYKLNTADLEKQGYDGVILKTPNGNVDMVFDNTQIKSATDNIGTFDKNNPDIRYDIADGEYIDEEERRRANAKIVERVAIADVGKWSKKDIDKLRLRAETVKHTKVYSLAETQKAVQNAIKALSANLISAFTTDSGASLANVYTKKTATETVARALTNAFNSSMSRKEKMEVCRSCADYLIMNTLADDVHYAEQLSEKQAKASTVISALAKFKGKISVSTSAFENVKGSGAKKADRIAKTWFPAEEAKHLYSPFEMANTLAEQGITLDIESEEWSESDVMLAIDKLYNESLDIMGESARGQIGSPEGYRDFAEEMAQTLYEQFEMGGKASALEAERERFKSKVKKIRDAEFEKRKNFSSELRRDKNLEIAALKAEQEAAIDNITLYASIQKTLTRIKDFAKNKRKTGVLSKPEWSNVVKTAGKIMPHKYLSPAGAMEFADMFQKFLNVHAPKLYDYGNTFVEVLGEGGDIYGDPRILKRLEEVQRLRQQAEAGITSEENDSKQDDTDLEIYRLIDKNVAADIMWLSVRGALYEREQIENDLLKAKKKAKKEGRELTVREADEITAQAKERAKKIPFSPGELEVLSNILKAVVRIDARYNQIFKDGRWQDAQPLAQEAGTQIASYWNKRNAGGKEGRGTLLQAIKYNIEDPEYVAARVGGYMKTGQLARMIHEIKLASIEAQFKEQKYMRDIERFFETHSKFAKNYKEQKVEFKYDRIDPTTGKNSKGSITLSLGEFLSLYMTSKRKQAFIALASADLVFEAKDGIRKHKETIQGIKPDFEGKTDAQIENAMNLLGSAMIQKINSMFSELATQEIRDFVGIVEKFYETTSKSEKQNMDELIYGYSNVSDGYYYPIARDKGTFSTNLIGNDRILDHLAGVHGFSFNKNTVERASKPLLIEDVMTVTSRHAHQLAIYTTLTLPLDNFNRIYNTQITVDGQTVTLKDYIDRHVWRGFGQYMRDYFKDVQSISRKTGGFGESELIAKLTSNYAKSVLALNLKSAMTQFSTLTAMQSQVSYKSWVQGMLFAAKISKDIDEDGEVFKRGKEMDRYSHAAAVRADSNEQYLATGVGKKVDAATDKLMFLQVITDRITCLGMWAMCQYEVQNKMGLEVGTIENKVEAGKLLDDMILELQDTSGAATKTGLARSTNDIIKASAMFRSSELKQWSRINYRADDIRVNGWSKDRAFAFFKDVGAFVGQKLYSVLLGLLFTWLRGKWEQITNEDKKKVDKPVLLAGFEAIALDLIGFVPIVGSFVESLITGYGTEIPATSVVGDLINSLRNLGTLAVEVFDSEPDNAGDLWDRALSSLIGIGQAFGVPVRNVRNFAEIVINGVKNAADSSVVYTVEDALYGKNYTSDFKAALESGDERLAATIIDQMMYDRVGSSSGREAASEIVELYQAGEDGIFPSKIGNKITITVGDESQEIELDAAQKKKLTAEYGKSTLAVQKLIGGKHYTRLTTEERAAAVRDMNSLYMARAKQKLFGADLTTAVAMTSLISEQVYIPAMAHIKAIKADDKVKNKKTQIERYLRTLGISKNEQRIILYAAGYRGEENADALKRAVRSSSLSEKEKKAMRELFDI